MKVKISKIDDSAHDIREDMDEEQIKKIANSMEEDGQWNPVILRPSDGKYELIAGHYRVKAAKELGWDKIEANVKDVGDRGAQKLALKTNLMRKEMDKREQGKALHNMMEKYDLSQKELAKKLDKSRTWIRSRVQVALDLHKDVAEALDKNEINFNVASRIAGVETSLQLELLERIKEKGITDGAKASNLKKWVLNDTIYTIGYSGKEFEDFLELLEENEVEKVIDIRSSNTSKHKAEFNGKVLSKRLEENDIDYEHRKELGVVYEVQQPYVNGYLDKEFLGQWYKWNVEENVDYELLELVEDIKDSGKTALMCMEKYPIPKEDQKHYCHRHYLAKLLLETEEFKNRKDL